MGKFLIFCPIQLKFGFWPYKKRFWSDQAEFHFMLYKKRWQTSWKCQLEITSNKKVIAKKPLTNLYEMISSIKMDVRLIWISYVSLLYIYVVFQSYQNVYLLLLKSCCIMDPAPLLTIKTCVIDIDLFLSFYNISKTYMYSTGHY